MYRYIVNSNPQPGGEHEVHRVAICPTLPGAHNQLSVGLHIGCGSAVAEARRLHPDWVIDGCKNCILACHTR